MNPGRELDALIAEKVMGLLLAGTDGPRYRSESGGWRNVPNYSTDIKDAWAVVEKLGLFKNKFTDNGAYPQYVHLWQREDGSWSIGDFDSQLFILSTGNTAPHAICLAALKALGIS